MDHQRCYEAMPCDSHARLSRSQRNISVAYSESGGFSALHKWLVDMGLAFFMLGCRWALGASVWYVVVRVVAGAMEKR